MDKGLILGAVIFVWLPIIGFALLISWVMDGDKDDGMDKGKSDTDSDLRIYVPSRVRNRGGNKRQDERVEEIEKLARKLNVKIGG